MPLFRSFGLRDRDDEDDVDEEEDRLLLDVVLAAAESVEDDINGGTEEVGVKIEGGIGGGSRGRIRGWIAAEALGALPEGRGIQLAFSMPGGSGCSSGLPIPGTEGRVSFGPLISFRCSSPVEATLLKVADRMEAKIPRLFAAPEEIFLGSGSGCCGGGLMDGPITGAESSSESLPSDASLTRLFFFFFSSFSFSPSPKEEM